MDPPSLRLTVRMKRQSLDISDNLNIYLCLKTAHEYVRGVRRMLIAFAVVFVFWDIKAVFYALWRPFTFVMGYSDPRKPTDDKLRGRFPRYMQIQRLVSVDCLFPDLPHVLFVTLLCQMSQNRLMKYYLTRSRRLERCILIFRAHLLTLLERFFLRWHLTNRQHLRLCRVVLPELSGPLCLDSWHDMCLLSPLGRRLPAAYRQALQG
jgi:hypothetical protein